MANSNSPHGFSPVATVQGNSFNAQCHMYSIPTSDTTNTYSIGDAVATIAAGGGDSQPNIWGTFGIPAVVKASGAAAAFARGVIVSVFRNPFALDQIYVPQTKASTYYVLVYDDPYGEFLIQPDGSASFTSAWIGANANYTQTAVNAATISNTVLATSGIGAGSTMQLRILGVQQQINVSTGLYTPLRVTWNAHELKSVGTTAVA